MARIRSIHPGIFTDEAFVSVVLEARLLFIGLWGEADDQGVFEWKPLTLKMRLFAADAIDVAHLLEALELAGMLQQFEAEGKLYGAIRNFCRYQRPKAPKHVHPLPNSLRPFVAVTGKAEEGAPLNYPTDVTAADRKRRQRENERDDFSETGSCHGSAVTSSEMSRQMEEEGGSRKEAKASKQRDARAAQVREFEREFSETYWPAWPNRADRKASLKAYIAVRTKGVPLDDLLAGIERYRRNKPADRQWMNGATFLNGERWLDEGAPLGPRLVHSSGGPVGQHKQTFAEMRKDPSSPYYGVL